MKLWKWTTGCRQAKVFIRGPHKRPRHNLL